MEPRPLTAFHPRFVRLADELPERVTALTGQEPSRSTMPTNPVFELYEDSASEWRWRLVAPNGNIIADSGEGYVSKQGARRGIESVKRNAPDARIQLQE